MMISNIINETNNIPGLFYYIPNFLNKIEEKELYNYLDNTNNFIANPKFNDGNSRMQKWFQTDGKYFCPLWKKRYEHWNSFEMNNTITKLINKVQTYIYDINIDNLKIPNINSCLITKYASGENFIAPHRDSELSFGLNPTIIGLSIGQTRNIYFERIDNDINKNFSFELESSSIFIMAGSSQQYFTHSIKKELCTDVRYSLTFREFIL